MFKEYPDVVSVEQLIDGNVADRTIACVSPFAKRRNSGKKSRSKIYHRKGQRD